MSTRVFTNPCYSGGKVDPLPANCWMVPKPSASDAIPLHIMTDEVKQPTEAPVAPAPVAAPEKTEEKTA